MKKITTRFIIGTFVALYAVVSVISTIHVIDFFLLSNPPWLAVSLAIAFEIGAAASLASLIALDKMNKALIWFLFILLTCMQMMGNAYYAYMHIVHFQGWIELFGLVDEEVIYQKRILSIISGAILPLVALGFIKSLVDYIKPDEEAGIDIIIDDGGISQYIKDKKEKEAEFKKHAEAIAARRAKDWEETEASKLHDSGDNDSDWNETVENIIEDIENEPTSFAFTNFEDSQETESQVEQLHTEEEKKQVIQAATDSSNSQSSVEINNINKELTEDDITKYREATKTKAETTFHPQVFR